MTRIGKSDAQANAEALHRRESSWSEAHRVSVSVAWDWSKRQPRDLREAVRMVVAAYEDEVPRKLHDHENGEGGSPRMTAQFIGYLDSASATDAGKEDLLMSHYLTPFRAALDRLERGSYPERRRARMIRHLTIGGMSPTEAATKEGAHPFDAKLVIEDALRAFLRTLSDLKVEAAA